MPQGHLVALFFLVLKFGAQTFLSGASNVPFSTGGYLHRRREHSTETRNGQFN